MEETRLRCENERLREELAAMTKRAEDAERHGYFCPHCDAVFPLSKEGAFAALSHEQSCHKSPIILERDRLQADNARLRDSLERILNSGSIFSHYDIANAALRPVNTTAEED